jgi:hypothetical protein
MRTRKDKTPAQEIREWMRLEAAREDRLDHIAEALNDGDWPYPDNDIHTLRTRDRR